MTLFDRVSERMEHTWSVLYRWVISVDTAYALWFARKNAWASWKAKRKINDELLEQCDDDISLVIL